MKFGHSVAAEGDTILVGAPNYSGFGNGDSPLGVGCVFRFALQNNSWAFTDRLLENGEFFQTGSSVATDKGKVLIGMPGSGEGQGKVMVRDGKWNYLYDEDPHKKRKFGSAVAVHNGQFVITAIEYEGSKVFFGVIQ
jgi:hypothetical protein